jgi:hypothetical protein
VGAAQSSVGSGEARTGGLGDSGQLPAVEDHPSVRRAGQEGAHHLLAERRLLLPHHLLIISLVSELCLFLFFIFIIIIKNYYTIKKAKTQE